MGRLDDLAADLSPPRPGAPPASPAPWDVLIRHATLLDGAGGPARFADLALANGLVATIAPGGSLPPASAAEVFDARGLWVMPGLLDIHTHLDLELELDPRLPEVVRHGTTTVVIANCSLGLAFGNQRRNGEDPLVTCFARVENMPKPVLEAVAGRVDWQTTKGYLEHLDRVPLAVNVVPLVPHSMLRAEVMGLEASVTRHPTPAEEARMEALLVQAMEEGYAGFSTDALPFHYLAHDPRRRTKIPSQWGSYRELKRLTHVPRRFGRVWQATPPKDDKLAVLRTFALTSRRHGGRPLKTTAVAALDVVTDRSLVRLALTLQKLLNGPLFGGKLRFQALAAPFRVYWDGPINPLAEEIPELRELNEPDADDASARARLLADPAFRARFTRMWHDGRTRRKNKRYAFARRLAGMTVVSGPIPEEWQGETLEQVWARAKHFATDAGAARSAAEADHLRRVAGAPDALADDAAFVLHLFAAYDTALVFSTLTANDDPATVARLLDVPDVLPGFNDSGAHLTHMAFYDANLRGLQLAQAKPQGPRLEAVARHVQRLTAEPAAFFGVRTGRLQAGWPADVTVIDPSRLAARDFDAPDAVQRVWRAEFGHHQLVNRHPGLVPAVWVAGRRVWDGRADNGAGALTPPAGREKLGRALRAGLDADAAVPV